MKRRYTEALTPREQEVIELLSIGRTNEQIARQLGISVDGVKYHVSGIFRRLRVANRHEAASLHLGTKGGVLTPREQEVIELLSGGLTNEAIARQMGISVEGVKYHVSGILRRLDVESRREAASLHLRTAGSRRLAALAPVMILRKLPFAWLAKAVTGVALTAAVTGVALLAWGVMSTSSGAVTTTGCVGSEGAGIAQGCARGAVQAGEGSNGVTAMSDPCALKDGGVWCWSASTGYGQTGSFTWGAIPGLAAGVTAISGGCALKDGGVWCTSISGDSLDLAQGAVMLSELSSGVSAISGSCALKDGGVWCWGANTPDISALVDAVVGVGDLSLPPLAVSGLASGVSAISAAADPRACALKDGGVWCWGPDYGPPFDNPGDSDIFAPVAVSGLPSGVTSISGSCALKDGGLWCWDEGATAVAVPGLERGVSAVAGKLRSSDFSHDAGGICAIKDGGVWCWDGDTAAVAIAGLTSGVSAISTGAFHRCALKEGRVWCWGFNGSGQLGDRSTTSSQVAVAVDGLASGVQFINASENQSCAGMDDDIWCWGYLGSRETGDVSLVPVPVRFTSPSAGDTRAAPGDQPSPSQTSTDSREHRTAYVLAGSAAAALAIVVAGVCVVRRRRRIS